MCLSYWTFTSFYSLGATATVCFYACRFTRFFYCNSCFCLSVCHYYCIWANLPDSNKCMCIIIITLHCLLFTLPVYRLKRASVVLNLSTYKDMIVYDCHAKCVGLSSNTSYTTLTINLAVAEKTRHMLVYSRLRYFRKNLA